MVGQGLGIISTYDTPKNHQVKRECQLMCVHLPSLRRHYCLDCGSIDQDSITTIGAESTLCYFKPHPDLDRYPIFSPNIVDSKISEHSLSCSSQPRIYISDDEGVYCPKQSRNERIAIFSFMPPALPSFPVSCIPATFRWYECDFLFEQWRKPHKGAVLQFCSILVQLNYGASLIPQVLPCW
jgi:hypothetical protein